MRIVVTGRGGQVARSLLERAAALGQEVVAVGRPELDLAESADAIGRTLEAAKPDAIVSAAAYTAVDKAEAERDLAFAVNEAGARAIARFAASAGVPLVHLSTDYVFDGAKDQPYRETDLTGPTGVYGASKLAGEHAILECHSDVAIVRTAWVYSPFGANFVKTMLRLAADRDRVSVVADQRGNPTSALDIADGVLKIVANLTSSRERDLRGVFHMTGSGDATWAEFAEAIFATSASVGGPAAQVEHIATVDYPTPAQRPANSRLSCVRLADKHNVSLPNWRCSIDVVVQRLARVSAYGQRNER